MRQLQEWLMKKQRKLRSCLKKCSAFFQFFDVRISQFPLFTKFKIQSSTNLGTTNLGTDHQLRNQFLALKVTTNLGTDQNLWNVFKSEIVVWSRSYWWFKLEHLIVQFKMFPVDFNFDQMCFSYISWIGWPVGLRTDNETACFEIKWHFQIYCLSCQDYES